MRGIHKWAFGGQTSIGLPRVKHLSSVGLLPLGYLLKGIFSALAGLTFFMGLNTVFYKKHRLINRVGVDYFRTIFAISMARF